MQRAWLFALLVLGACECGRAPERQDRTGVQGSRTAIKVPMPKGWTHQAGARGGLAAGPPPRTVLRIERRSSWSGPPPPPSELLAGLDGGEGALLLEVLEERQGDDFSAVRARLTREGPDGGVEKVLLLMVGAKRAGTDLLLCSTEPGATDAETRQALAACAGLTLVRE